MRDPMLDEEFLRELDQYPHKFLWAKIISLNMDEYPLEEITGKVTSGSVNVDGSSSVRRTCSLSMVAQDVNINEFYWGLKTKFRFYIGVENWINSEYPDIIWFNQGMFMITSFNCTAGVNNYTINLQGKDKMTLLNGDLGGVIPASWDFATEDANAVDENGDTLYDSTGYAVIEHNQIPIKDIVLQAVHEFAQEPWQNIIINDLDDYGIELLEYEGETPLYYIIKQPDSGDNNSREVWNMTTNGAMNCLVRKDTWENGARKIGTDWLQTTISQLETISFTADTGATDSGSNYNFSYEKLMEQLDPSGAVTESPNYMRAMIKFEGDEEIYTVAKITRDNGLHVCGYRITDIVYPYDLITAPGDTVTSVLDKLIQMLGNFEYFYDVDGRFIFQKKRTYLDVSYNNIINEHSINSEVWANSGEYNSKYSYVFDGNYLVSSIQNSPNLSNLKNDYSLWGSRESGNITIPIHLRYAIDKKPMYYKVIGHTIKRNKDGKPVDENNNILSGNQSGEYVYEDAGQVYITQDGLDYLDNLKNNPDYENDKIIELNTYNLVDWREIIYQMANDYRRWYRSNDFLLKVRENNMYSAYDSFYEKGYTGYEKYYIDFEMNMSQGVVAYWRELYNPTKEARGAAGRYQADGKFISDALADFWVEGNKYAKGDLVTIEKNGSNVVYKSLRDDNDAKPGDANANWVQSIGQFTYNSDGWNTNILNNPEMLNFWFDFIDTTGELNKYSVHNIGLRSKATNDDKIKAIYFREVPNVIFDVNGEHTQKDKWTKPGYCYINIPAGLNALFHISSRGKNAMDVVEEYLYNYTYPASAISLTTVPIYHLTPNTLIYVDDKQTGIVGEYIMQKYSIQLGLGASMNISAVETAKRLY